MLRGPFTKINQGDILVTLLARSLMRRETQISNAIGQVYEFLIQIFGLIYFDFESGRENSGGAMSAIVEAKPGKPGP